MVTVIAEIGINHNGNLALAKKMIKTAKECGADFVKFQIRDVETVYAGQLDGPRNDGNPYGWKTVREQKNGIELTHESYYEIDRYCNEIDMPWFASCWDEKSFDWADVSFDWPYHKIASAMLTNDIILKKAALSGKKIIMSVGGSTLEQILHARNLLYLSGVKPRNLTVMHCVAQYPCDDSKLNLRFLSYLPSYFAESTIGYSGHEVGLLPSVVAIGLGAKVIERHFTLDRSMYGSDQSASMEPHGLAQLCSIAHRAEEIIGDGIKSISEKEAACMRKLRYWEK